MRLLKEVSKNRIPQIQEIRNPKWLKSKEKKEGSLMRRKSDLRIFCRNSKIEACWGRAAITDAESDKE